MEEPNAEPIARAAREPRHPSLNTSLLSAASQEDTMIEYLKSHPQGFSEMPFNSVDSLILSTLSYLDLDSYPYEDVLGGRGVPVVDIVRFSKFESLLNGGWISASKELPAFVEALLRCRRFADLSVRYFVQEDAAVIEKQFCACTFSFGGKTPLYYLAFRGTDGTLAGWKEDFNLSYRKVIPSQRSAERYVSGVLSALPPDARIMVGGHSKGGNLAEFAAATVDETGYGRIERIFNHDGPSFLNSPSPRFEEQHFKDKLDKTVPESSIFGMMLEHRDDFSVVQSQATGIFQHNPFSWVVDGTEFRCVERISAGARYVDSTLANWVAQVSPEERERFIDALFQVINATDATRFADIRDSWQESVPKMLAAAGEVDPETRSLITRTLGILARSATVGKVSGAAQRAKTAASKAAGAASSAMAKLPAPPLPRLHMPHEDETAES